MNLKNIYITTIISVACLIIITTMGTYAYFAPDIEGAGKSIRIASGKIDLVVSNFSVSPVSPLKPIYDNAISTSTDAYKTTFTVSKSDDSNLDACYGIYLYVDEIGENLKSEYFKYRFESDNTAILGSFDPSRASFDANGKAIISLIGNEYFSKTDNTPKEYTLTLWLSYDSVSDQSNILLGTDSTRTFKGHLVASGRNGVCN